MHSPNLGRQAKPILPGVAVPFTSGYPLDEMVDDARLNPGVELVSKPSRSEDLASKLLINCQGLAQSLSFTGARPEAARPVEAAVKNYEKLNVLVVEDNPDSKDIVCELISMLGHDVRGVSDAEQALILIDEQNFDILFTDVSLPGMTGIELAKKVLGKKPATQIVFSTGHALESIERIGFKAKFLRKPYDLLQLESVLVGAAH